MNPFTSSRADATKLPPNLMATGAGQPEPYIPEIARQFEELRNVVESNRNALTLLAEKLAPVLGVPTPANAASSAVPPLPQLSPLAENIRAIVGQLADQNLLINGLRDLLEI